ncbi:MAG: S8 family serine peptidase, partial [Bacteroidales bacterium]|nr:S8 family serine peptidase [Bacteroidales bacterium]
IRNNGKGVAAIGSGVTVMGVRCATNSIPQAVSNGFAGVRWAAEHGAKVISLSWGSYSLPSQTEQEILKTCYDQGIILVAAAGNNHSTSPFYPAASPYVISVGATNSDKIHANEFSNYGKWVDILAPGGFIKRGNQKTNYSVMSTTFGLNQCYRLDSHDNSFAGQYYDGMFGTSMATPIAASLCGLLLSVDSTLDAPRMRELLASSAQILSENEAYVRDGSGLIDAFAAIKMLLASRPAPDPVRYTILPPKGVELTWDAPKGDNLPAVAHYRVYRNGSLVKDRLQETAFTDGDLRYGNYSYAVEAVFEDQSVSLKNGVDFAMPQYRLIDAVIAPDSTWGQVTGTGYYLDCDTAVL